MKMGFFKAVAAFPKAPMLLPPSPFRSAFIPPLPMTSDMSRSPKHVADSSALLPLPGLQVCAPLSSTLHYPPLSGLNHTTPSPGPDLVYVVTPASASAVLASWFRLKYPHIVIGAFASSAPVLYFDDTTPQDGYTDVVTKEASQSCYETIKQSWSDIDELGAERIGLDLLGKIFHTCSPLNNTQQLKDMLGNIYAGRAQYDAPPPYSDVDALCACIDGATEGATVLERMYAGIRKSSEPCIRLEDYDDHNIPGNHGIGSNIE